MAKRARQKSNVASAQLRLQSGVVSILAGAGVAESEREQIERLRDNARQHLDGLGAAQAAGAAAAAAPSREAADSGPSPPTLHHK